MHAIGVSTVNSLTAHKEWATRPPDERYQSVQALHDAAHMRRIATESIVLRRRRFVSTRRPTRDLLYEARTDRQH
jgi:hypothetical protein